jgi:hypothetical protein
MSTDVNIVKFTWDGSDIGSIDDIIFDCAKVDDDHLLTLWSLTKKNQYKLIRAKILKYKNEVPIIIDECKPLFGLKKVGKHKASLNGTKIILVNYKGDVSLKRYFSQMMIKPEKAGIFFKKEIQKLFIFRWVMCLNNNFENTIEVRTGEAINYPISCRENTFNYNPADDATRIPKNVIKNWFNNSDVLVDTCIHEFIKDKDVSMLRFEIQKIIQKFDKNLICWNNGIFENLLIAKI